MSFQFKYIAGVSMRCKVLRRAKIHIVIKMDNATQLASLLLVFQFISLVCAEYVLHTFNGEVGAGNYTYYKLTREGDLRLVLYTENGDSDLYISDKTLHPDFENYELQSVTCGDDELLIPTSMKRPIGIGVYGHPSQDTSKYVMSLLSGTGEDDESSNFVSERGGTSNTQGEQEEQSILYTVLVGILKIAFDILL
jgi:hypothetical protein